MMSQYRQNSVLLLKGEKKDEVHLDSYISVLGQQGGYDVTCIPVLDFHFVNLDLLTEALNRPDDYSCLLMTSQRAVDAISKAADAEAGGGHLRSNWSGKTTFVVGSATGQLAESIGLKVKGAESGNSEKLATILIEDMFSDSCLSSKPVLFPCGNLKLETLPSSLRAAGLAMKCLTVYETTADGNLKQNLETFISNNGCVEYIVFYSPSGVKYAFHLLQQLGFLANDVKLVAIGPTTEKAIVTNGGTVWGTSAQPNAEQLLQLLLSHGQKSA